MATTLYFRTNFINYTPTNTQRPDFGTNMEGDTPRVWTPCPLTPARGDGVDSRVTSTPMFGGPVTGVEVGSGTTPTGWYSPPVTADVLVAGTITLNLRAEESAMAANAQIGAQVYRMAGLDGALTLVAQGVKGTELGTSEAAQNFALSPTSTQFHKGDRFFVVPYFDDAPGVTMSGSDSMTFYFDGTTAGASGDSYITFTETIGLAETDPTGTSIYLTDAASDIATAAVDREARTVRGAGVQTDVYNTSAWEGQLTDTSGGTVVDWWTRQLQAFTLSGVVLANIRFAGNNVAAGADVTCEIARVEADGSSPTIWGVGTALSGSQTSETADRFYIAGDDLAISDGQRLRIRLYVVDDVSAVDGMTGGYTLTVWYAGTSAGASGDTYLTFGQTITESGSGPTTKYGDFDVDAVLLKSSGTKTFTLDAELVRHVTGAFTASAIVHRVMAPPGFTLDAVIPGAGYGLFGVYAVKLATMVGTAWTADAILHESVGGDTTIDAEIALPETIPSGFTVDAVIRASGGGSFTAGAITRKTMVSGTGAPSAPWILNDQGSQTFRGQVSYGNGYWVVARTGSNPGVVMYATDPAGTWTDKSVGLQIFSVHFLNGYFYALGGDNSTRAEIWRAQDPTGTWTQVLDATGTRELTFLAYSGSMFVAVGPEDVLTATQIFTSPDGETWTHRTGHGIPAGVGGRSVAYADGYWAMTAHEALWYTTDPTGAWTENTAVTSAAVDAVYAAAGYWVVPAAYRVGDPTGDFTDIPDYINFPQNVQPGGFWYANGTWAAVGPSLGEASYRIGDPAGGWTANDPGGNALGTVAYGNGYWVTAGFTAAGTIRYQQVVPPIRLDAELGVSAISGSFTLDAQIVGSVTGSFHLDAVLFKSWDTPTFSLDAQITGSIINSFHLDAILLEALSGAFSLDAQVFAPGSFTLDAFIQVTNTGSISLEAHVHGVDGADGYIRLDAVQLAPDYGSGSISLDAVLASVGQVPARVSIWVGHLDVTSHVQWATAEFRAQVNGTAGSCNFDVLDKHHEYDFTFGEEIVLYIDGKRRWGGFVVRPLRTFPPSVLPDILEQPRKWTIEGVDYNIIFSKRIIVDTAHPARVWDYAPGTYDDTVINDLWGYLDMAGFGRDIHRVAEAILDIPGVNVRDGGKVASGGFRFSDALNSIIRNTAAIYYCTPDRMVTYVDSDLVSSPYTLTDTPYSGDPNLVAYREVKIVEDNTDMVNDSMVWGAGKGDNNIVFSRHEDTTSQDDHGLWQSGIFTAGIYKQATADALAASRVDGSPAAHRGAKNPKRSVELVTWSTAFGVGDVVNIENSVFDYTDVLPIRAMTVTFPTPYAPRFALTMTWEIDVPWSMQDPWLLPGPGGGGGTPPPPPPSSDRSRVFDNFNRESFYWNIGLPAADWFGIPSSAVTVPWNFDSSYFYTDANGQQIVGIDTDGCMFYRVDLFNEDASFIGPDVYLLSYLDESWGPVSDSRWPEEATATARSAALEITFRVWVQAWAPHSGISAGDGQTYLEVELWWGDPNDDDSWTAIEFDLHRFRQGQPATEQITFNWNAGAGTPNNELTVADTVDNEWHTFKFTIDWNAGTYAGKMWADSVSEPDWMWTGEQWGGGVISNYRFAEAFLHVYGAGDTTEAPVASHSMKFDDFLRRY